MFWGLATETERMQLGKAGFDRPWSRALCCLVVWKSLEGSFIHIGTESADISCPLSAAIAIGRGVKGVRSSPGRKPCSKCSTERAWAHWPTGSRHPGLAEADEGGGAGNDLDLPLVS